MNSTTELWEISTICLSTSVRWAHSSLCWTMSRTRPPQFITVSTHTMYKIQRTCEDNRPPHCLKPPVLLNSANGSSILTSIQKYKKSFQKLQHTTNNSTLSKSKLNNKSLKYSPKKGQSLDARRQLKSLFRVEFVCDWGLLGFVPSWCAGKEPPSCAVTWFICCRVHSSAWLWVDQHNPHRHQQPMTWKKTRHAERFL